MVYLASAPEGPQTSLRGPELAGSWVCNRECIRTAGICAGIPTPGRRHYRKGKHKGALVLLHLVSLPPAQLIWHFLLTEG